MPEIEQSPSRFLLPRTSSIHPTPPRSPASTLPATLKYLRSLGSSAPRRRPPSSPSSTPSSSSSLSERKLWQRRRSLAGIDNHGDGAVLAGFSPPKLASFARKHPRRASRLSSCTLHLFPCSSTTLFVLPHRMRFMAAGERARARAATYVGITAAPTGDFIPPSVNSWESSGKHRRSRPESFEIR